MENRVRVFPSLLTCARPIPATTMNIQAGLGGKIKRLILPFLCVTFLAYATSGCGAVPPPAPAAEELTPTSAPPAETPAPPLEISSSAFGPGGEIPTQYTCHGANQSPPLEWSQVPEGTRSLTLLVDDLDSQPPGFVHWVIYNIPPTAAGLPEGVPPEATLEDGTLQGSNDFANYPGGTFPSGAAINQVGYDGPCPGNPHRYVFTLYALDTLLDLPEEATMAQVLQAMEGHILTQGEVIGTYSPQQ